MSDKPSATIRTTPSDFVVEEIPAYEPSGNGEHLFVTFEKTGLDTMTAVRRLAQALGVHDDAAGWAGMKDRHAVTTQTASFHLRDGEPPASFALDGIDVLSCVRHEHKLKAGHLRGNRFTITLRDLPPDSLTSIEAELAAIARSGLPNFYGEQRFGREGDNAARALGWLTGNARPPRAKKQRRLLFSALQSKLFNEVLARRVADGSWLVPQLGDVVQKHDTGGVFQVGEPDLDNVRQRAAEGLLSPTGPMFGAKMRWPEGAPGALEREVLEAALGDGRILEENKRLGRGTRRPLRLIVEALRWDAHPADRYLVASFVLPKGGYATTVLSTVCDLVDATRRETTTAATAPGPEP